MANHSTDTPREPVLTRAGIITALTVLAAVLVRLHLGSIASWLTDAQDPLAGLILAAGPLYTALLSRKHVTPLESPKDNAGNDLVPAGSTLDTDAAARSALALAESLYPAPPTNVVADAHGHTIEPTA